MVSVGLLLWPTARVAARAGDVPREAPSPAPQASAGNTRTSTTPARGQDAILQKLDSLEYEIRTMRGEMAQLRKAVIKLGESRAAAASPGAVPAPGTRISLDAKDPVLGSPAARVAIVEFSDFQCPYCERFHQDTFAQLKKAYVDTGKVQYTTRSFPLLMHPLARDAAIAAHCAGKQDAYWKMREGLFNQQSRLGPDLYRELSANLKLDDAAFTSCLKDPASAREVDADLAFGQSVGVRGTPSFFVGRIENGQLVDAMSISGAKPFPVFAQAIESLLK
jgi:protein-disulfide isomerase